MSIEHFTDFILQISTNPSGGAGNAGIVSLERGTVYVVSTSQWVKSIDGKYQVYLNGAQTGISYLVTQNTFQLDCFGQQGVCQLLSPAGITELKPGQKISFQGDTPGLVEVADCTAWQSLKSAECIVPLATPTIIVTETPTPVPPTPTPRKPTNNGGKPDRGRGEGGDKGGGGGSGSGGGG
jgi:hypothetical protein